jgi:uncharacterized membrane protein
MLERLLPGLKGLQNIHPLVVHFPIAFLSGAVLLYFLSVVFHRYGRGDGLQRSGFVVLVLGTLSALVAVTTGLYAEGGVMVARSVRSALLEPHEQWMMATTALSAILTGWAFWRRPMPQKGKTVFLILLVVMMAVLAKGGDYGARMVYEYNAGGSACGQPIEFNPY